MAKKNFTIVITPDEVLYTSIHKAKDGYNSARIVAKKGEKEYLAVTYEWEGNYIPTFAMDLMGFMQANEVTESGAWPEKEVAYEEFSAKKPADKKKKKDDKNGKKKKEDDKDNRPPWLKKKKK